MMHPSVVAVIEAAERLAEGLWSDINVDAEQVALCQAVSAMHDAERWEDDDRTDSATNEGAKR